MIGLFSPKYKLPDVKDPSEECVGEDRGLPINIKITGKCSYSNIKLEYDYMCILSSRNRLCLN